MRTQSGRCGPGSPSNRAPQRSGKSGLLDLVGGCLEQSDAVGERPPSLREVVDGGGGQVQAQVPVGAVGQSEHQQPRTAPDFQEAPGTGARDQPHGVVDPLLHLPALDRAAGVTVPPATEVEVVGDLQVALAVRQLVDVLPAPYEFVACRRPLAFTGFLEFGGLGGPRGEDHAGHRTAAPAAVRLHGDLDRFHRVEGEQRAFHVGERARRTVHGVHCAPCFSRASLSTSAIFLTPGSWMTL